MAARWLCERAKLIELRYLENWQIGTKAFRGKGDKSVGTRSGVVPGAPVGVLASWDVGAPRSDCQAVPEKEGQIEIFSVEKCWPGCHFQYCHRK